MTIETCVNDYIRRFRKGASDEMAFFANQPTLSEAIRISARSGREDGKRHPHQCRILGSVLREAEQKLHECAETLQAANDFDALLAAVDSIIRPIHGIGELAVYDIAHRLGAFLNLEPQKVHLHQGTRVGAASLGFHGSFINRDDLPAAFSPLSAAEVEDCLCIYKDDLVREKSAFSGRSSYACFTASNPRRRPC